MNTFQHQIFTLLHTVPLSLCRRPAEAGGYALPILLVGGMLQEEPETRLFQLLNELLGMGQFLDTDLSVTLAVPDAAAAWQVLKRRAPSLLYFAAVSCDGTAQEPETPAPQEPTVLAELRLLSAPNPAAALPGLPGQGAYCIFCTGSDSLNRSLCKAAQGLWPTAQTVCVQGDGFAHCTGPETFQPVVPRDQLLEQWGYLQHYTYCKYADPHRWAQEIRGEFEAANYNHTSSLRAAVHFEAKLCSLGVHTSDPAAAAGQLAQKLEADPGLVDRLAYLEHNRWLMEKVLDGYSTPEGKIWETIYTAGKVRTTHDEATHLHTALVPCNETSHLTPEDFDAVDSGIRPQLDPLDRVTLEIYRRCKELGKQRHHTVLRLLRELDTALGQLPESQPLQKSWQTLDAAVREVYKQQKYACTLFNREEGLLRGLLQQWEGQPQAAQARALLDQLKAQLGPQLEADIRKDYKSVDRFLCRTIPFQMTYKPDFHLVKFLTENSFCNLFSLYQQEPGQVDFFALADGASQAEGLLAQARKVRAFVTEHKLAVTVRFTMYCPETSEGGLLPQGVVLRPTGGEGLRSLLKAFLLETRPDYLETTGLAQQALFGAFGAAAESGTPMFCMEGGKPHSPEGGLLPLAYPRPEKPLTVSALLDMGGSYQQQEGDHFDAQLAARIKSVPQYWRVFQAALGCQDWNLLCEAAASQLSGKAWDTVVSLAPDTPAAGQWSKALAELQRCGAVAACPEAGALGFRPAFPAMTELLRSSGRVLESALYYGMLSSGRYDDVELGASFADAMGREREVDVVACVGQTAYFISCKMGAFAPGGKLDAKSFQFVLDEVSQAASLFAQGARVVPVLAAPRIPMQGKKKASDALLRARKSGVVLLGREVFESHKTLCQALVALAEGTL